MVSPTYVRQKGWRESEWEKFLSITWDKALERLLPAEQASVMENTSDVFYDDSSSSPARAPRGSFHDLHCENPKGFLKAKPKKMWGPMTVVPKSTHSHTRPPPISSNS